MGTLSLNENYIRNSKRLRRRTSSIASSRSQSGSPIKSGNRISKFFFILFRFSPLLYLSVCFFSPHLSTLKFILVSIIYHVHAHPSTFLSLSYFPPFPLVQFCIMLDCTIGYSLLFTTLLLFQISFVQIQCIDILICQKSSVIKRKKQIINGFCNFR